MTGNSVTLGANTDNDDGGGAVYSTGGNITLTNSTLSGNSVTDAGGSSDEDTGGAAVYQNGSGAITITGSTIDGNHTTISSSKSCDGGAVYENADAAITVTGSQLNNNTVSVPASTDCCNGGAAVYDNGSDTAPLTVTSSTMNDDTANITDIGAGACCDGGGATFSDTSSHGSLVTIDASTLDGDQTTVTSSDCCSGGGAIASFTTVDISGSTLNSNTSAVTDGDCCDGGGAINVDAGAADSTVTGSELLGNTSTVNSTRAPGDKSCCNGGGAIRNHTSGGNFTITGSDLSDNTSKVNAATASGGGALFDDSTAGDVITNSTFIGNTTNATGTTGGGGAIFFNTQGGTGTEQLSFVTIAGNSAGSAHGGGIFGYGTKTSINNSIVATNTASTGGDCGGATFDTSAPTFTSLGFNLEDSPDSCNFTATGDKVVAASTLGLEPLAANGGATMTRSLLAGSPAINAIPIASCTDQASPTPVTITTDQRGVARPEPAGGNCDIGAFEFGDSDLALTGSAAPAALKVGQHATITLSVSNAGPVPATTTTVALSLPSGLRLISGGSCSASPCSLGAVLVHAGAPATFVLEPTKPGRLTVKATAATTSTDPNGTNNSQSFTLNATLTPTLTHVSQSHKTWSEGSKLAHLARRGKAKTPPVGTAFSFTLNEAAKVTFKFMQGHKTRGTLSYNAKSGKRKLSFDGRPSRSKKLKPGKYTVVITAKGDGLTSKAAKLSFTIA